MVWWEGTYGNVISEKNESSVLKKKKNKKAAFLSRLDGSVGIAASPDVELDI